MNKTSSSRFRALRKKDERNYGKRMFQMNVRIVKIKSDTEKGRKHRWTEKRERKKN